MRYGIVPLLLLACVCSVLAQESTDPRFGPEGEAHILEQTGWLEAHPLAGNRAEVLQEVLTWWIEAPHLTLNWCPLLLTEATNEKAVTLVSRQAPMGGGAYLIRHPDQGDDDVAIAIAGVESALRTYEAALGQDDSYRDAFYDSLVEQSKTGRLRGYVVRKLDECAGPSDQDQRDIT